jgi:hypothetical protein
MDLRPAAEWRFYKNIVPNVSSFPQGKNEFPWQDQSDWKKLFQFLMKWWLMGINGHRTIFFKK